jgi:hypothetical protein
LIWLWDVVSGERRRGVDKIQKAERRPRILIPSLLRKMEVGKNAARKCGGVKKTFRQLLELITAFLLYRAKRTKDKVCYQYQFSHPPPD